MTTVRYKAGVGCQWTGIWLMATAAILAYGETAPTVQQPNFTTTLLFLLAGLAALSVGCSLCAQERCIRQLMMR